MQALKEVSPVLLKKYFSITEEALALAKKHVVDSDAVVVIDMVERYLSDGRHFEAKGDFVRAFGCVNYAHGWLDCAARLKLIDVHDSRLFTAD